VSKPGTARVAIGHSSAMKIQPFCNNVFKKRLAQFDAGSGYQMPEKCHA